MSELTRLEKAAVDLSKLLRWGLAPADVPERQQCEWPYRLTSTGEWEMHKLVRSLQELDNALEERGLKQ